MSLRPVKAIELPPGLVRAALTDFGAPPERVWIDPVELLIDDVYQRDLNRRSMKLIEGMVKNWKWRRMKTPDCVRVGGKLHVIDGQHTAIAAATLGIKKIPVDVVDAKTELERADSFVSYNQNRLTISALDIYRAQVGGGEPVAMKIEKVCKEAGIRLKVIHFLIKPKVGDSAAISAIRKLVVKRDVDLATNILGALVKAGRAPVSAAEITAAEEFYFEGTGTSATDLAAVASELGPEDLLKCQARATTERISTKTAIIDAYRKIKAKRK
jgi:hypothetical protein